MYVVLPTQTMNFNVRFPSNEIINKNDAEPVGFLKANANAPNTISAFRAVGATLLGAIHTGNGRSADLEASDSRCAHPSHLG